ncbi:MAG: FtsQ-type POTRA domain-containing protein [Sciscionella sp.]|nr:FtsQ-type POTRA domain-containing protein [Sciscionella sp.]
MLGLGYVLLFSPVLGVRSIQVVGNRSVPADAVVAAANVPTGSPMLRVDIDGVASRVAGLPQLASARVVRSWPSTLLVEVTERTPLAYAKASDGAHLIDATGHDFQTTRTPPNGLPQLLVSRVAPDDASTKAALQVLGALPAQLRKITRSVSAQTPGDVRLALTGNRTVQWGGTDSSSRKAEVLAALLSRPGTVYDVSSPDLATVH